MGQPKFPGLFQCELIYTGNSAIPFGWSEKYYRLSTASDYATLCDDLEKLASFRNDLLGFGTATLVRISISDVNKAGDIYYRYPSEFVLQTNHQQPTAPWGSDVADPDDCLLVDLIADRFHRGRMFFRLPPNQYITGRNVWVPVLEQNLARPVDPWNQRFFAFRDYLVQKQYMVVTTPKRPDLPVAQGVTGVGKNITDLQIRPKLGNRKVGRPFWSYAGRVD